MFKFNFLCEDIENSKQKFHPVCETADLKKRVCCVEFISLWQDLKLFICGFQNSLPRRCRQRVENKRCKKCSLYKAICVAVFDGRHGMLLNTFRFFTFRYRTEGIIFTFRQFHISFRFYLPFFPHILPFLPSVFFTYPSVFTFRFFHIWNGRYLPFWDGRYIHF